MEDIETMARVPNRFDLLWPILKILEDTGGSASNEEILTNLATDKYLLQLGIGGDSFDILHGQGPQTKIGYQAAWSRTLLNYIGAIQNSSQGVWSVTAVGREIPSESKLREMVRDDLIQRFPRSKSKESKSTDQEDTMLGVISPQSVEGPDEWKQHLIQAVKELDPVAFERLCQRLLREAGFINVEVTGRSGDGGIDGRGILRISLMAFRVGFQCKRYTTGPVPARDVREFMGALQGSADSGIFVTTSYFSRSAIQETKRDGTINVDLIDGNRLCDLLKQFDLGTKTETIEQVSVEKEFFTPFKTK